MATAHIHVPPAEVQPFGLGYRGRYTWGLDGYMQLTVSRLRETRGELAGQLEVSEFGPPPFPSGGVPLAQATMNLSSLSSRKTFSSYLEGRLQGPQWAGILECFCRDVLALYREDEPILMVGGMPPAAIQTHLGSLLQKHVPNIWFGPPGSVKSTMAAAAVVAMETGREVVPGLRPDGITKWLILDWEASDEDWNEKAYTIGGADYRFRYQARRRPLADDIEKLAMRIDQEQIDGVIVDSLEKASGAGGDNFQDRADRLFAALRMVPRVTWLLLDHSSSADRKDVGQAALKPINSIMKEAWARQLWSFVTEPSPTPDRVEFLMRCTKNNRGRKGQVMTYAVNFKPDQVTFERNDNIDASLQKNLSVSDRMRLILLQSQACTDAELAAEIGCTEMAIRVAISRAKDRFVRLPDKRVGLAYL